MILSTSCNYVAMIVTLLPFCFVTVVCEPPCSQGVCAEDNMCSCNSGYDGDRCEMQGNCTTDQKLLKFHTK